jgi:YgiT-type zinc finger domain-containing protein
VNKDPSESKEFCAVCHVGSLRPHRATYARWHEGQFVIRPGMLAWRCDFCGMTFYDDAALARLALLLGPETDLDEERQWPATGLEESWEPGLGDRRRV